MTSGATAVVLLLTCLASIFPIGHRDRSLTINQILERDFREKCLSGGAGAKDFGVAATGDPVETNGTEEKENQEEDLPGDEVEKLLAAAESAATR